ncbi:protein crumbs homolog 1 isoform 1-T1 [Menidia menidia]
MIMDFIRYRKLQIIAPAILISALFVIHGASTENLPTKVDACSPNPCQNRALCRTRGDGYSCFCVPGFQGAQCHIDVNECVSQPCRNGATCVDRVGRFSCACLPGFTGTLCEIQIDDCQSQPCHHGGSCHNYKWGFTCTCPPGFQGHQCEINIDECQEHPCQNGALCIDGVNEYSCDCSNTAFTGQHCEMPLPPCYSEPCFNSAICKDNQGNYTCDCSPGSLCQAVMNNCEPSPCQNGGRCESNAGGYTCHCLKQSPDDTIYGGVNCDVRLVGCEGHECQNQGSCFPFLLDGTHGYTCSCAPGYTGPLCKTATTFSFERRGYLLLNNPLVDAEVACNITLSFKTVMPTALLFQRNTGGLLLSLVLAEGQLRLTLRTETEASSGADAESFNQVLELPHNVTDGDWHSVEAVLANWVLSLKLLSDAATCASQACDLVVPVQSNISERVTSPQNTLIGGIFKDQNGPSEYSTFPAFIGCMRDVFVDWQLVVPEQWLSDSAVNVSPGCSHRDRCLDVPCQNRGQCVNLWQSYQCQCPRPYEGHDCEEEHVTARFGSEDSHSYAVFTITDDLGQNLSISLFLRTRKRHELLLVVANNGSQYLGMWLEDGRVTVQLHNHDTLQAGRAIHDGEVHFVNLEVVDGQMTLYVAGHRQGDMEVGTIDVQAGDTVYVGGLLERRSTSFFGGYFKGCIQDLRISDRRLQFFGLDTSVRSYPLELMENVTTGCTGDNTCSKNPCLNGGMCFSKWDDFTCTCPPSTSGRRCEEVKWCDLSPCPSDAECRMLNHGYECYSNATFMNDSTVLSYRGNGHIFRNLTDISLSLRTRKRNAAILHAEKDSAFITVSIQDGVLFMELQSTPEGDAAVTDGRGQEEGVSTVSLSSRRVVSDGEWHAVHLFMTAPWDRSSRWTLVMDEEIEEASISRSQGGNLNFLRQDVDIFLGGLAPDAGWSLAGCMSTVELGGLALSYFSSSEVNLPRLQKEQFVQTSPDAPLAGCSGASVCEPNPCLNNGECQDLFNAYNCTCPEGWAGRRCDLFVDACISNPCIHGNCSVYGLTYECTCEFGYSGADCEEEVDVCENHLCAHGGLCLHGPDSYSCLCPENYTGLFCNERIEETPWYIVKKERRPKLPVSVCGDDTRNYTCFNGGNCTDRELSCDCPPGFTGHRCEMEVDECNSNPCLNGGYCRNLINKFVCVCDMSFAGDVCQTDMTSPGAGSDLLLSISLASVILLLVLILTSVSLVVALNRRATHGTYSPSRQEKAGSRVEMWSITQPPPMERLI